jgi:ribosomal protein L37AE/L43A
MHHRDLEPGGDYPQGEGELNVAKNYPSYLSSDVIAFIEKPSTHAKSNPEGRNWYICENCFHTTVTRHADEGVTPMFHTCEKCGKWATSSMYRPPFPEARLMEPTEEWYRPDDAEFNAMPQAYRSHYAMGGLRTRRIPKPEAGRG